ncbi:AMP-binding protein, partial [Paenibacillus sp. T1]
MYKQLLEPDALARTEYKLEREYWMQKLQGSPIPSRFHGKSVNYSSSNYGVFEQELPSGLYEKTNKISNGSLLALYILLLSGVKRLLSLYSNNDDVLIGMPHLGIEREEKDDLLALRTNVNAAATFRQLLNEVRRTVVEADKHPNVSYEDFSKIMNSTKTVLWPLETIVLLENVHDTSNCDIHQRDMIIAFHVQEETIDLKIQYNQQVYSATVIAALVQQFILFLDQALEKPDMPMSQIELVSKTEQNQLLELSKAGEVIYPRDRTIHQLFEAQVERTPDNIAVVFEEQQLTYRELNERANQLARVLREKGVQADSLVGLMVERSLEMIVGIMAILKAGGAYVPIDPEYPTDRIRYMLEDSGTTLLVTQSHLQTPSSFTGTSIALDEYGREQLDTSNLQAIAAPDSLAYIIYTSGSTGRPKGVMIEHRNVVQLLMNNQLPFTFGVGDVWTMFHSYCFDFSVWELFGALLY